MRVRLRFTWELLFCKLLPKIAKPFVNPSHSVAPSTHQPNIHSRYPSLLITFLPNIPSVVRNFGRRHPRRIRYSKKCKYIALTCFALDHVTAQPFSPSESEYFETSFLNSRLVCRFVDPKIEHCSTSAFFMAPTGSDVN